MTSRDDMLAYLRDRLDPTVRLYAGAAEALPKHWQDYASDDKALRRFALRQELAAYEPYLPSTMAGLEQVALDAFMVQTDRLGVLRIIARQIRGKVYGTYSALPTGDDSAGSAAMKLLFAHGPKALAWTYRTRMNGLTDSFGFAGFKTSALLTTMADEADTYAEADWYAAFAKQHDTRSIVEFLATGGGAYLLLDLSRDQSAAEDPEGLVVYMNEGTPPETVSFFQYLDMFMELGLTDSGR